MISYLFHLLGFLYWLYQVSGAMGKQMSESSVFEHFEWRNAEEMRHSWFIQKLQKNVMPELVNKTLC